MLVGVKTLRHESFIFHNGKDGGIIRARNKKRNHLLRVIINPQ